MSACDLACRCCWSSGAEASELSHLRRLRRFKRAKHCTQAGVPLCRFAVYIFGDAKGQKFTDYIKSSSAYRNPGELPRRGPKAGVQLASPSPSARLLGVGMAAASKPAGCQHGSCVCPCPARAACFAVVWWGQALARLCALSCKRPTPNQASLPARAACGSRSTERPAGTDRCSPCGTRAYPHACACPCRLVRMRARWRRPSLSCSPAAPLLLTKIARMHEP